MELVIGGVAEVHVKAKKLPGKQLILAAWVVQNIAHTVTI